MDSAVLPLSNSFRILAIWVGLNLLFFMFYDFKIKQFCLLLNRTVFGGAYNFFVIKNLNTKEATIYILPQAKITISNTTNCNITFSETSLFFEMDRLAGFVLRYFTDSNTFDLKFNCNYEI